MKLFGMAKGLSERLGDPKHGELSHAEFVGLLVQDEKDWRDNARLKRLLKAAKLDSLARTPLHGVLATRRKTDSRRSLASLRRRTPSRAAIFPMPAPYHALWTAWINLPVSNCRSDSPAPFRAFARGRLTQVRPRPPRPSQAVASSTSAHASGCTPPPSDTPPA
ncbi:MAG: hypothetical protein ACE5FC_09635 [Myxococcota bacterium]